MAFFPLPNPLLAGRRPRLAVPLEEAFAFLVLIYALEGDFRFLGLAVLEESSGWTAADSAMTVLWLSS